MFLTKQHNNFKTHKNNYNILLQQRLLLLLKHLPLTAFEYKHMYVLCITKFASYDSYAVIITKHLYNTPPAFYALHLSTSSHYLFN